MRNTHSGTALSLRAIAGTHVVALAWDLKRSRMDTSKLLGFAVERTEFKTLARQAVVERYFLRGIKRFEDKDKGLPPGTPVPTSEHPIQTFQWGDYTARPSTAYTYRVVPVTGLPRNLTLRDDLAIAVDIRTEPLHGPVHSIFFNRGAAGSQAYAREFPDPTPNTADPTAPQNAWLSRGLYEALVAFVGRAKDATWGLRAALYEFHYDPVGRAFKAALDRKADVKILYDDPSYGEVNRQMIERVGLGRVCAPRKSGGDQKHNKFIVLLKDGKPLDVWTGSTNISDGGIFGHSNVGHSVRSARVAGQFLDYWTALCNPIQPPPAGSPPFSETRTDPGTAALTARNLVATPTPIGKPASGTGTALFSPRPAATLSWYAERMAEARQIVCFMVAFTLAKAFEPFLSADSDVLRFVLSDKQLTQGPLITRDRDVVYAAGAKFDKGELPNFLEEKLSSSTRASCPTSSRRS